MSIMNVKQLPEIGRNISRLDCNPGIQELEAFTRNKTDLRFNSIYRVIFLRRYPSDIFAESFLSSKVSSEEKENVLLKLLSRKILLVGQ